MARDWRWSQASFDGASFYVDASRIPGRRRIVTHEYPGSETHDNEDLGRDADRYEVTAYFVSETADSDFAAPRSRSRAAGPGPAHHSHVRGLSGARRLLGPGLAAGTAQLRRLLDLLRRGEPGRRAGLARPRRGHARRDGIEFGGVLANAIDATWLASRRRASCSPTPQARSRSSGRSSGPSSLRPRLPTTSPPPRRPPSPPRSPR